MKRTPFALAALLVALSGCAEQTTDPDEAAPAEQGGEAAGDIEGGTISDAMIPLEALRSQSPTIERRPTTGAASSNQGANAQASVEPATSAAQNEAPAPAPPVPPAAPDGRL